MKCFAGQHWRWDQVDFKLLHPNIEGYQNHEIKDNNMSCVAKVTSRFGSILLTGDIEKEAESILLDVGLQANIHKVSETADLSDDLLKSEVLIVPHHGSRTSSTQEFLANVGAEHAIFTVGYLNRFKHPKPLIKNSYEESGALLYRSDYHGALKIDFTRNNPIKIEAWRQSQPRYWHDKY